jgi:hypothetical protein
MHPTELGIVRIKPPDSRVALYFVNFKINYHPVSLPGHTILMKVGWPVTIIGV